jgi:ATPase subunit of ABC transporter with duplicated ATPase domains
VLAEIAAGVTPLQHLMTELAASGESVSEHEARSCLGACGLSGKLASETPVLALSGGQKVRHLFILTLVGGSCYLLRSVLAWR